MIQFSHVHKTYSRPARPVLEDIHFEVKKGELVILLGPTGAGKSTILKLLFGLEHADAGQILVLGHNIQNLKGSARPYFRRKIGFVFQDFRLFSRRTIYENVSLAMKISGVPISEIKRRMREVLQSAGLEHKHPFLPSMLSAGEQQRVCIARAIVNHPQILLADEPTGNLDSEQGGEIVSLLKEINMMGATVVIATHREEMVAHIRSRVIFLRDGKIKEDRHCS